MQKPKTNKKPHTVWFHVSEMPGKGKFIETESRSMVAYGWGWEWGLTENGQEGNSGWLKHPKILP